MAPDDAQDAALIKAQAEHLGLPLTEDEVTGLVAGVRRNRGYAEVVRWLLNPDAEPAPVFNPATAGPREDARG